MKIQYNRVQPYTTKDGSEIRELMHPDLHRVRNQSLAEAIVRVNAATLLHRHMKTEELYHISQGNGIMILGQESFDIKTGDTICIPPGTPHMVKNTGSISLKMLCCCSPAYSHEDTEIFKIQENNK